MIGGIPKPLAVFKTRFLHILFVHIVWLLFIRRTFYVSFEVARRRVCIVSLVDLLLARLDGTAHSNGAAFPRM